MTNRTVGNRIFSILLAGILAFGIFPAKAAAAVPGEEPIDGRRWFGFTGSETKEKAEEAVLRFQDVPAGAWYEEAVLLASRQEWLKGVSDTSFSPHTALTRGMLITALYRMAGSPAADGEKRFSDVPPESWFEEAVQWGAEEAIILGYDNGAFGPYDPVTREQVSAILYRYAAGRDFDITPGGSLAGFSDGGDVSPYAERALQWACAKGILKGRENARIAPKEIASRGEAAVLLQRFTENGTAPSMDGQYGERIRKTAEYLIAEVPEPTVSSIGGEWAVFGLAVSGYTMPQEYYDGYYRRLAAYAEDCGGVLSRRKYSEYSRVTLALTAIGKNPGNVEGYDFLPYLSEHEAVEQQGITGVIYALLALDSGAYPGEARQLYLDAICSSQLEDGGFALSGETADPDVTAMALCALANYREDRAIAEVIDKGLSCLSHLQKETGGFESYGEETCESVAQVLVALSGLGIQLSDRRFVKNGNTMLDALERFAREDGSFSHTAGGEENLMATEQAMLALAALKTAEESGGSIYAIKAE